MKYLVVSVILFFCTLQTFSQQEYFMYLQTDNSQAFYWVILGYSLLYTPTIALSNSVAFSQMTDAGASPAKRARSHPASV